MATKFEAITDTLGRVDGFLPKNHDTPVYPQSMGDYLDGGETVRIGDKHYVITPNGSVVHPSVKVPKFVSMDPGVRIDEGTKFTEFSYCRGDNDYNRIRLGEQSRVNGATLEYKVEVDKRAVIGKGAYIVSRAKIGEGAIIGDSSQIGTLSEIGSGVEIGEEARINFRVRLLSGVVVGPKTYVDYGLQISANARVGAEFMRNPSDTTVKYGLMVMSGDIRDQSHLKEMGLHGQLSDSGL